MQTNTPEIVESLQVGDIEYRLIRNQNKWKVITEDLFLKHIVHEAQCLSEAHARTQYVQMTRWLK